MGRPSKGQRKLAPVRVPADVHAQLVEIKALTGVEITDQLAPLVIEYADRALLAARNQADQQLVFEEAPPKSA